MGDYGKFSDELNKIPNNIDDMTKGELHAKLEKGYADMIIGRTSPTKEVFAEFKESKS